MKILVSTGGATTIGDRMLVTGGKSSGFDYLRIALAFAVILSHSFTISLLPVAREEFLNSVWYKPFTLILPMFFALSGFLVAGSYERSKNLIEFYGLRVLRIVPALTVETCISALVLGPIVTDLKLADYFSDPKFVRYFFNIVGHIQYELPGVFANNSIANTVNSQLWTIPFELYCYIVIGLIGLCGLYSRRHFLLALCSVIHCLSFYLAMTKFPGAFGINLILAFVDGILMYRYREKILWSRSIASTLFIVICLAIPLRGGTHIAFFPAIYLTVYLGLTNPPRWTVLLSGDYSYGMYLYGFAIQQAVFWLGPWTHSWWRNLILSFPLIIFCSVLSWWLVEKPVLHLRKYLRPKSDSKQSVSMVNG